MSFIYKVISPDEKLLGIAQLHWIYGAKAVAALGISVGLGLAFRSLISGFPYADFSRIGDVVFILSAVTGFSLFLFNVVMQFTTELGLTTQRIIYKKGLFFVDVREIDLEEIKSANVDNGFLGRILNYGYIQLDARFIKDIQLPAFEDPYRILKVINEIKANIKSDSLRLVIDQPLQAAASISQQQHPAIEGQATQHQGQAQLQQSQPQLQQSQPQVPQTPQQVQPPHLMKEERYRGLSNNPATNLREVSEEVNDFADNNVINKAIDKHKKYTGKTRKFKGKNQDPNQTNKRPKFFVHVDALRQKVLRDFKKAEEN